MASDGYHCPYYLHSNMQADHPCKLTMPRSLKCLYRHVARVHLKALACPACSMRFGQSYELRRHRENRSCKGPALHNRLEAPSERVVDLDMRARACRGVEELCEVLIPGGQVNYDCQRVPDNQAGNAEGEYSDEEGASAQEWVEWLSVCRTHPRNVDQSGNRHESVNITGSI